MTSSSAAPLTLPAVSNRVEELCCDTWVNLNELARYIKSLFWMPLGIPDDVVTVTTGSVEPKINIKIEASLGVQGQTDLRNIVVSPGHLPL